jgi:D-3-phosphoglycerate dehydrogenase
VIITPHAAFLSEDSLKQSRRMALEQLVQKLIKEEVPTCLVN